jgi:hypothetical protein
MKQAQKNQIESIAKKSWIEIIKIFLAVFFLKNPIVYFPLWPRINPKKSLIQIIKSDINLGCFAIAFKSFFYADIFKTWSNNIGLFIAIRYKGKVIKQKYFMPSQYKFIYKAISNQNGFILSSFINTLSLWFFRFAIALLIGLIFSLQDIELPYYQEAINNMQYMLRNISVLF